MSGRPPSSPLDHTPAGVGGRGAPDDRELLERFARWRDGGAFAALVERHGPAVLRVCRRQLRCEADAEDALQVTFLLLARRAGSVRRAGSLASWLHGAARRVAANARRAAARRARHERRAPVRAPAGPPAEAGWREVVAALEEEVAGLPQGLRAPFVLCQVGGLGCAEAARRLGLGEATVWGRLARARRRLRERLAARGADPG